MKKLLLFILFFVSGSHLNLLSCYTIPIINKTAHPVTVTIVSNSEEITSTTVAPTVEKIQQFCGGLTFSSIKYIIIERPTEKLPQVIRYPYIYESQKIYTTCHTQHDAMTSWYDAIGKALNENYCSGKSVALTTEESVQNNIVIHKNDTSMALNGIFKASNYDKIITEAQKSLSCLKITKINKSIESLSRMLEDFTLLKKLNISNMLMTTLEKQASQLLTSLSLLSSTASSLQENMMNIDMISSIIKKKHYTKDDITIWNEKLDSIIHHLQTTKNSSVASNKLIIQNIKQVETKYKKLNLQISKLSII